MLHDLKKGSWASQENISYHLRWYTYFVLLIGSWGTNLPKVGLRVVEAPLARDGFCCGGWEWDYRPRFLSQRPLFDWQWWLEIKVRFRKSDLPNRVNHRGLRVHRGRQDHPIHIHGRLVASWRRVERPSWPSPPSSWDSILHNHVLHNHDVRTREVCDHSPHIRRDKHRIRARGLCEDNHSRFRDDEDNIHVGGLRGRDRPGRGGRTWQWSVKRAYKIIMST